MMPGYSYFQPGRDALHGEGPAFLRKLAEAGAPKGTMLDMMGHVSAAMLGRESYMRARAHREVVTSFENRVFSRVVRSGGR
jgi:hypothetical protein